jgi:hypothetical protein
MLKFDLFEAMKALECFGEDVRLMVMPDCRGGYEVRVSYCPELTESFFKNYEKKGVCAIHAGMSHKWTYPLESPDLRTCKYCGETQQRQVVHVPTEKWASVAAGSKI